ncbi:MAG: hypothetical protein IJU23_02005, partial [Proteobacteria bacterium]|nr:hypothetical protein [Pseudomonadota bacterium]
DTDPGNATTDKIFLLSYVEVTDKYLKLNRKAYATLYVVANGVKASIDKKTCTVSNFKENKCVGNWWLRTPGSTSYNAVYVVPEDNNAIGYMNGNGIKLDDVGVRPAMWLNY